MAAASTSIDREVHFCKKMKTSSSGSEMMSLHERGGRIESRDVVIAAKA